MADPRFDDGTTKDLYREFTVSFPGGSITSSKDVLQHVFANHNQLEFCNPEVVPIARKAHTRTAYPGAEPTQVKAANYDKKNYSNGGTSRAAGGEPIRILIKGDWWRARLVGSHQAFMDYLCDNRTALADGFTYWKSQAGKPYSISNKES